MIKSFRGRDTRSLFERRPVRRWKAIERAALRKLVQLDLAQSLQDLRSPPGNRLEVLSGDRKGQWSVRVNDQYRVCFRWTVDGAEDVEITDYH
jgi:proteic killer suppression protein